jgi:hypothetical protein
MVFVPTMISPFYRRLMTLHLTNPYKPTEDRLLLGMSLTGRVPNRTHENFKVGTGHAFDAG